MNKLRVAALAAIVASIAIPVVSWAGGVWQNWPGLGQSSYCAAIVGSSNVQAGTTGQGTGGSSGIGANGVYCAQTVPAGPATFSGNEFVPADIGPLGVTSGQPTNSVLLSVEQLGNGPMLDVTAPATATIAINTPWYFLDGAQGSAFTITMPAAPYEGYIQRIVCESATVGALTVAANTNQTLKGNPGAACVAGTTYSWRYQASNTTWYRF